MFNTSFVATTNVNYSHIWHSLLLLAEHSWFKCILTFVRCLIYRTGNSLLCTVYAGNILSTASCRWVCIFRAYISDAMFILSSTSGYSTTFVLDLVLPKYKHGIGNIGPEYKYSAATRSTASMVWSVNKFSYFLLSTRLSYFRVKLQQRENCQEL